MNNNHCPLCDHDVDIAGSADELRPGDIIICPGCSTILWITEDEAPEIMPDEIVADLDPTVTAILNELQALYMAAK